MKTNRLSLSARFQCNRERPGSLHTDTWFSDHNMEDRLPVIASLVDSFRGPLLLRAVDPVDSRLIQCGEIALPENH